MGVQLERELPESGASLGGIPISIYLSKLEEWLAIVVMDVDENPLSIFGENQLVKCMGI